MAKKNENIYIENNKLMSFEDIMAERFSRYSKYIIQERALPDARDGLKPVQRRILYAMYKEGNIASKPYRKSAKTVGIVIGNYHPHGDSSVYEAMVRMSQYWKMNHKLVDIHGNNGSIDDDPAAAMRYTEARLENISMSMVKDIDYNTVLMTPNFDDTELEPTVMPSRFPLLLTNGATGIASGYATNIPPHNLGEVIDATVYLIDNPQASVDDICEIIKGPDFPTGGIVQGTDNIKEIFTNGKGRVVVRAKIEKAETKTLNQIIVHEIPYEVIKSELVKQIDEIRIEKEVDGILDVRDESDRNGLKIVIDVKKDADQELILNYLYKNTNLQVYYNYNMVAIIDKTPRQCSIIQLIDSFIRFRKEVVLKRSQYLLNQIEKRLNILEGLMKAVSIMDEIIELIRSSNDKADAKNKLIEAFLFNEEQAEAIVTLRLYRLTNTDIKQLKEEFATLLNEKEELKTILSNEAVLNNLIRKELKEIKDTFARERITDIEDKISEIVIDKVKMVQNDTVMVTVSKDGYLKRVPLRSYKALEGEMTAIKEGDQLIGSLQVELLDTLLLFTNKGNFGYLPVYQLAEYKWKEVGDHLNSYMKLSEKEYIVDVISVRNFESYAFALSISKLGNVKKTKLDEYILSRNSKLSNSMKLKANDEVTKVIVVYPNQELVFTTKDGFNVRYNEQLVSLVGNKSQGVRAIKLSKDDYLVNVSSINNSDSFVLLYEYGKMKRIKAEDLSQTNRAVKGERVTKIIKTNPLLLKYAISKSVYESITIIDQEVNVVALKDIPLMSKDSSSSSILELSSNYYLLKGIQDAKIIDKPDNYSLDVEPIINDEQDEIIEEVVTEEFQESLF